MNTPPNQPEHDETASSDAIPDWPSITSVVSENVERLRARVRSYFERFGWPARESCILAALSGGPDSVAMLIALLMEAPEHGWRIRATHVNYKLRGSESDDDERFCRALADRWKVKLLVHTCGEPTSIPETNRQEWARNLRYRFFDEVAALEGARRIAIAHTIDDRAETVAAAVIDAAGTFALSGIPPVRGDIIRPLFDCRRDDIVRCLSDLNVSPRSDSSNESTTYTRNRIRHEILPTWERENPAIVEGLARLGEQLWRQNQFMYGEAEALLTSTVMRTRADGIVLDTNGLAKYDSSLDPFVLRLLFRQVGATAVPKPATVNRFEELRRAKTSGQVQQGDVVISRSKGQMMIARQSLAPNPTRDGQIQLSVGTVCTYGDVEILAESVEAITDPVCDNSRMAYFDSDKVLMPLCLRESQEGDEYAPLGLGGHKKLADLFADSGVPSFDRRHVPVIADNQGIIWPIGHPIADRVRITSNTRSALRVMVTYHE